MYTPASFAERDEPRLFGLMDAHPFATLVVPGEPPEITHLPLVLDRASRSLTGHVARANPIWRLFDGQRATVAIFHGPDTYVTPRWYAGAENVPTWNYAVVHVHGVPAVLAPGAATEHAVRRLVEASEAGRPDAWSMDGLDPTFVADLLRAIVAFSIPIAHLVGKLKLSQNRLPEDRAAVMAALTARGTQSDREMLALMKP